MTPTTEIKHTVQRSHRWLLNGMLPLAACMAIVTATPAAHAELTNQSVACAGAQKTDGEGGSASTFGQQQKTEGEGGSAALSALRQKTEGEGGSASIFAQQQKTVAIPCKG
jgi:hypothetical protein